MEIKNLPWVGIELRCNACKCVFVLDESDKARVDFVIGDFDCNTETRYRIKCPNEVCKHGHAELKVEDIK